MLNVWFRIVIRIIRTLNHFKLLDTVHLKSLVGSTSKIIATM